MEAVVSVAIALCVFVGAVLVVAGGVGLYKVYSSMKEVAGGLRALNDNMSGVPAIMEGVKAICVELSSSTVKVGTSVDKLSSSLFDSASGPRPRGRDSFQAYDDGAAGREHRIMQVMQERNLSRTQAADLIKAGLDYDEERFVVTGGLDE